MKCHTVKRKLSAYQDKELSSEEHDRIKSHLLSCRSCREQYENLDQLWQTLGKLERIEPDPWFYRQVVRQIEEPREKGFFPTLGHVFQLLRTPAVASLIIIAGLGAGSYLGGILARPGLFTSQTNSAGYSPEAFFTSVKVFDPAPPGTFAEGYLRMVSHKESESR